MNDEELRLIKFLLKKHEEFLKDWYSKYAVLIPSFGSFMNYLTNEVKKEEKEREEYSKLVED